MTPLPRLAVVVGATGGLGGAFVEALAQDPRYGHVLALARNPPAATARVASAGIELTDEASVAAAAKRARALGEVRLVVVATGVLHGGGMRPEKQWGALDPAALARAFAINSTGPALVAKHFLPLVPRNGRSVFAALSARVGSIEDNRLGGWYAYRASKAALNMLLRTFAIELARRAPEAICLGLHPGTVDTALSAPFQDGLAHGKLFTPAFAAARLLEVIEHATVADSGCVLAWSGARVPA